MLNRAFLFLELRENYYCTLSIQKRMNSGTIRTVVSLWIAAGNELPEEWHNKI
jgi:hypothetical protein